MDSYFLLDLKGPTREDFSDSDVNFLGTSFIEAYNSLPSCNASYRLLEQVTILQDAVDDSYGDTFSYILRAQGKCTGCNEGDIMLYL